VTQAEASPSQPLSSVSRTMREFSPLGPAPPFPPRLTRKQYGVLLCSQGLAEESVGPLHAHAQRQCKQPYLPSQDSRVFLSRRCCLRSAFLHSLWFPPTFFDRYWTMIYLLTLPRNLRERAKKRDTPPFTLSPPALLLAAMESCKAE